MNTLKMESRLLNVKVAEAERSLIPANLLANIKQMFLKQYREEIQQMKKQTEINEQAMLSHVRYQYC